MLRRFQKMTAAGLAAVSLLAAGTAYAEAGKLNMSYLYFGSTQSYVQYVDRSNGALQTVSPSFFDLTDDGRLQLSDKLDAGFVEQMHARGVKVVPFLSNHWNRAQGKSALQNRAALVDQIAEAVAKYGLDGINVDIENVTETERDAYTDLVKRLRAKLTAGKEVSVAVAANPKGWTAGWQASYDYAELAEASDYLMIMAYDETYEGVPEAGPVASLSFVEESIRYALTQAPADKLVLGIPFYGRYWLAGSSTSGTGISNEQVEEAIARFGGTTHYDEKAQSPWAAFTVPAGDAPFEVNYAPLAPGSYTVWYENDRSIQQKLRLVQKYGLKGAGSWSLHQETKATWDYFSMWLNGVYFTDMIGHWAQKDVMAMLDQKWMVGVADDRFAPEAPLTRAQAAAILVRAKGLASAKPAAANPFADVPAGHWAAKDIAVAKENGLIEGTGARTFAPDQPITREEMAAMLARVAGVSSSAAAKSRFSDVSSGLWSYSAINAMTEQHILEGFPDGTFRPKAQMTRSQMAALMNRAAVWFRKLAEARLKAI
ncbi:glycosyl hydrolase family 18 protein [Paenibacillus sp. MBLB4367]|uniref:glycosyl hydrolase family 18 protein n=1 Tax=Paenibacillus sp. MBLB4367 TaxID=3384767 RepID=UPI003907EE18